MKRTKAEILVADSERDSRMMLKAVLDKEGYGVLGIATGTAALKALKSQLFDLILMDAQLRDTDGVEVMREIKKTNPFVPVVMMAEHPSVRAAVDALKLGAYDYLTRPLDIEALKVLIEQATKYYGSKKEKKPIKGRTVETAGFTDIVGESTAMKRVFETLSLVAPSDATVLVYGETGTGKELVADAIHGNSLRAGKPFVKVNCAALPETLLESELFGHERGAFTGAARRKPGRFELADGGTVFLDEVGDMSLATQVKLLRVLQEREVEPLGGTRPLRVNIRLVAATHRDLEHEVKEGRFREDLFYRLNVVSVTLPSLRERRDDIPLLARSFLDIYRQRHARPVKGFLPKTLDALVRHDWPGNVRELENVIERAVLLCRSEYISTDDLPPPMSSSRQPVLLRVVMPPGTTLEEVEKEAILQTLHETGGNRTSASQRLGITRKTLQNKLKEYGLGEKAGFSGNRRQLRVIRSEAMDESTNLLIDGNAS